MGDGENTGIRGNTPGSLALDTFSTVVENSSKKLGDNVRFFGGPVLQIAFVADDLLTDIRAGESPNQAAASRGAAWLAGIVAVSLLPTTTPVLVVIGVGAIVGAGVNWGVDKLWPTFTGAEKATPRRPTPRSSLTWMAMVLKP